MFTITPLTSDLAKKNGTGAITDLVKISDGENFCIMTQKYSDLYLERVKKFKVFEDDVWLVSFVKTGTTWMQEMLRLIGNDLNYEKALKTSLYDDFPFFE